MTRSSISIIFRWCSDYDGMNFITLTLLLNGKPTFNHPYESENYNRKKKSLSDHFEFPLAAVCLPAR